jgi:hypothetical protein
MHSWSQSEAGDRDGGCGMMRELEPNRHFSGAETSTLPTSITHSPLVSAQFLSVANTSGKGKPAPYWATYRWVVERTSAWQAKLAHKKLVWCTERVGRVIDFWVAFSSVVIIVRRLIREGWRRYRWEGRPSRRP